MLFFRAYVSISNKGIQCYSAGSSINITNSGVFMNKNKQCFGALKKESSKLPKLPKTPKTLKLPSVEAPKALLPPPPGVASTTNRNVQPEEGYC